ncbi:soluble lytic murein transglycosylase [Fibrobacter sp. UWB15]|jgi:soluble lytic murein transglycosylase|uniref:lytic transglycosylase domain-containing protein n=1 Tax=unclassified Fibrobacter TaxID=2634177 RepID=UPI00091BC61D|nr:MULTISPECIES: lytic transglycosylase domain-containing protein [unclassified Fibrobacter]PWJ64185.1 soluble lytic murein transglycosylase [Fibrobacter sp. UWB6]SHG23082.1 soluble lytic murein transglycosylase [Fibrobacter sp. UWB8]SMG28291.1 soluble lytic murein transglycosylase [Fibrobacter sp. UWB15]
MRKLIVLVVVFCAGVMAQVKDSAQPGPLPMQATDSLIASMPLTPPDPYERLEQVPPSQFQDVVVRYDRLKALSVDQSQPKNVRDFARAAQFFYKEQWDSAYFAYDSLRGRDALLDGSVILRMAKCLFKLRDYKNMRVVLGLYKNLDQDASFDRVASRLRIEAAMADSTLSDRAHADSLKVFVEKYPKSDDAAALRYRYAQYLEQFKQMKEAKRIYLRLLTSASNYKDSAFAAIRRLRKVRGAPETLEEKVAYARMACAKDNANECLTLLDSINILDSMLVSLSPEAALPPPEDSLQKKLPPSSLDMATRIMLWEKRAVTLRTLKREDESIKQFKFLLESVEPRALWMQSILRLYRNNAGRYEKEIRKMDAALQDANQFSKENANNLWVKGFEYEQKEQYDSAIVCYKTLSHKRFKNNIKRQWAKFRIGFVYFKQEKWNEAIPALIDATKEPFLWSGSGARMFLGDAYMKVGKDSLAREAYLDCIRDFPLAYYAHRSRMKLVEYKLMAEKDVPYAHGVRMAPEQTLAWVRASQKVGKPDTTYNPERYNRIRTLFQYGFSDQAFALYDEARKKNAKRLDFLYEYGKLFYEMGETAAGYRLARQFQNNIDRRRLMAPPIDVLHYLFPVPYMDQVKFHSGERIDPFFVYSVMRQESIFNFEIMSPAGACGLLQIMPATGKMLAEKESIPNFEPRQLFNAYMNIRLGIRYLVDLKAEYNDDYMYVLGNYNAGPKPTKRWQAAGEGKSWDIRAEDISYWETRDYVKRVMGNYWIYQEIYDGL